MKRDKEVAAASIAVLYSPNSIRTYALIQTATERPQPGQYVPVATRQWPRERLATLAATLRSIGATKVALEASSLCAMQELLPNKGWFDYVPSSTRVK